MQKVEKVYLNISGKVHAVQNFELFANIPATWKLERQILDARLSPVLRLKIVCSCLGFQEVVYKCSWMDWNIWRPSWFLGTKDQTCYNTMRVFTISSYIPVCMKMWYVSTNTFHLTGLHGTFRKGYKYEVSTQNFGGWYQTRQSCMQKIQLTHTTDRTGMKNNYVLCLTRVIFWACISPVLVANCPSASACRVLRRWVGMWRLLLLLWRPASASGADPLVLPLGPAVPKERPSGLA